jgi:dGTP triphosphohydrolase
LPGVRPPLEAQLIDLADEIAYNAADLDDAFSAGFFRMDDIVREVPQYSEIAEAVDTQFAGAPEKLRFQENLRALINWLVSGLIEGTYAAAEAAGLRDVEDVRAHPVRIAELRPEVRDTNAALKKFLHGHVYNSTALRQERQRAAEMIRELFSFFLEHADRLPEGYRESAEPLYRQICDYIAGMTDGYFRRTYRQLVGPIPQSGE